MKKILNKSKSFILGLVVGLVFTSVSFASNDYIQALFTDIKISVNGELKQLQNKPIIYNGSTYLPVRDVANALGYNVEYDKEIKTIKLSNTNAPDDNFELSNEWVLVRNIMKKYNLEIGVGENRMIIVKNNKKYIFPFKSIEDEKISILVDQDNNIELPILMKGGRMYLSPSKLLELKIID